MNRYFTAFTLAMLFTASILTNSLAQTAWTKYTDNPVLDLGASGSWESNSIYHPHIIFDNTTYHMWYSAWDGNNERIGYATSKDGIHWKKYDENPILDPGPSGDWDDRGVLAGPVLVENDTLKMWYLAEYSLKTGLAISTDGVNWTKYDNPATTTAPHAHSDPVLQPGMIGSWDDEGGWMVSVLIDGGIYEGWYVGDDGGNERLGYATSEDGIHWSKYDDPATTDPPYAESDPVLDLGPQGSWDASDIEQCQVIKNGETYQMWYTAALGNLKQTGYATSTDGMHWTKFDGNPVLKDGPFHTWDNIEACVSSVLFQDPIYKMWYNGYNGGHVRIGYAEDFSHIAHSDSLSLNFSYARPGSDTLRVKGRIKNPDNNTLELKVHIISDDSLVVDSTELTHEQDEMWAAEWPVPETEKTYRVAIKTKDIDSGSLQDGMLWNVKNFTTIGPVSFESYEIIDTVLSVLKIKLSLKNAGSSAMAPGITVELSSTDPNVTSVVPFNNDAVDIPAGQTVQTEQIFNVGVKNSPDTLYFKAKIFSNGYHYWSDSTEEVSTSLRHEKLTAPKKFFLAQNYPNPFNPKTVIRWQVGATSASPAHVELSVYNLLGQRVATLVSEKQKAGMHSIEWDARGMASGVYYYMIKAGEWQDVKKMILLR